MANALKMVQIQSVTTLLERGWSHRRIARELGIDRGTVGRYDRRRQQAPSKPAISTAGSSPPESSKPAIPTAGSDKGFSGRRSLCEEFRTPIQEKLDQGLSAQRIYQDLVTEEGFVHSYESVKRYVRRHRSNSSLPFRRMECLPGQEAQVDFGSGSWVVCADTGKRRRVHILKVTLSHSRKSYSEGVFRQTTENFIRCIENAFWHFGGVPETLVCDNLKAAVLKADWFDPVLNPRIVAFARHYGFSIMPTKPYTPQHKGKIESDVKYVKNNALKGRLFSNLSELNSFLRHWESHVADTRIHGTTRKQVGHIFNQIEKSALKSLPADRFPFYQEGKRRVHRDGHVEVARSYYSVPPEYLGWEVWVQWDERLVRIFDLNLNQITLHPRTSPGKFHTLRAHIADEKISGVERGAEYLLGKAGKIGPESLAWAKDMIHTRGVQGIRPLQGFVSLASKYPSWKINRVSRIARDMGCFRLRSLKKLLQHEQEGPAFEFMKEHPLIRPLEEYEQFIHVDFKNQRLERWESEPAVSQ